MITHGSLIPDRIRNNSFCRTDALIGTFLGEARDVPTAVIQPRLHAHGCLAMIGSPRGVWFVDTCSTARLSHSTESRRHLDKTYNLDGRHSTL